MTYSRFALYDLPADAELARHGAAWLGWDAERGTVCDSPTLPGLDDVTMTPRKYGFHGTLKAPFRLVDGVDLDALKEAVAALALCTAPARCDGLRVATLGRFLALVPVGDASDVSALAARCVTALDRFRATPSDAELARRRAAGLTPAQDALLLEWGYPHVLEAFRFHITLTGALDADALNAWYATAVSFLPALPAPYTISSLALVGEREDGHFELLERYALTG
ncbi:MAG: DUF1045 domain-containing protein [Pseudomonadota bacterium]